MFSYDNIPSLRNYVLTKNDKNMKELEDVGLKWTKVAEENKLAYELDWLGVPIIQTPADIVLMQELIFKLKPDIIVETGIAHGGSLILYSSILELLNKGTVIGVDIEIREHNRKVIEGHPLSNRIKLIEGSSTSDEVISKLNGMIPDGSNVLVCLDSNHTKDHVFKELKLYQRFIKPGNYIVVFDTNTSKLAELGACEEFYLNNGPLEGVKEFLKTNDNFIIDNHYNKLFISDSPNGFLKRIK